VLYSLTAHFLWLPQFHIVVVVVILDLGVAGLSAVFSGDAVHAWWFYVIGSDWPYSLQPTYIIDPLSSP
jgi:hypothetical protein